MKKTAPKNLLDQDLSVFASLQTLGVVAFVLFIMVGAFKTFPSMNPASYFAEGIFLLSFITAVTERVTGIECKTAGKAKKYIPQEEPKEFLKDMALGLGASIVVGCFIRVLMFLSLMICRPLLCDVQTLVLHIPHN